MPPQNAVFPIDEAGTDLPSLETQVETNIAEIAYLKSEQRGFVQRVHKEQHDFAQRLEELHESQQDLLKKLHAIKSENHIQEINSLKAEKQLLRPTDSGIFSGDESEPEYTPAPSSKTARLGLSTIKRKAGVIDDGTSANRRPIKTERLQRMASSTVNFDLAAGEGKKEAISRTNDTSTRSRDLLLRSNALVLDKVLVVLNREQHVLELSGEEDDETVLAWKHDGNQLREEWKKQLRDFDKRNPDWPNKARTAGCVRSAILNQGKCYLTVEDEGEYACKTCWNTNNFCVAWDEDDKHFWLRPQLPAARSQSNKTLGPFDLSKYRSMKDGPSRQNLPGYWQSKWTT